MTLVEVLVGVLLSALALQILVTALVPSLRATTKGYQRIEMQQSASVALAHLATDLGHTPPSGLILTPMVAAHPVVNMTATGGQLWSDELLLYRVEGDTLVRGVWQGMDLGAAALPAVSDLAVRWQAAHRRPLALGVTEFKVTDGAPLEVRLVLKRGELTLALTRKVLLRNNAR